MSFIRRFNGSFPTTDNNALYRLLYDDVKRGIVFPALSVDRFDFYHGGGVLFTFNGTSFKRNPAYDPELKAKLKTQLKTDDKENFSPVSESTYIERFGANFIDSYDGFKLNNANHFNDNGKPKERQYLDMLYKHTYTGEGFPIDDVCVLDIEVRFNEDGSKKKCDMALFNSKTCEIMFVEGKIFSDDRMSF